MPKSCWWRGERHTWRLVYINPLGFNPFTVNERYICIKCGKEKSR